MRRWPPTVDGDRGGALVLPAKESRSDPIWTHPVAGGVADSSTTAPPGHGSTWAPADLAELRRPRFSLSELRRERNVSASTRLN